VTTAIAIVGPGAIGGCLAAWLSRDVEIDTTLCARTKFETLRVEGLERVFELRPRVITELAAARAVDWVLVATKTYDVEGTVAWLEVLRHRETPVAVFQNGVEHVERFRAFVPASCLVPVVIDCPAERSAPGVVRQRGAASMIVPRSDLGRTLASFFARAPVRVELDDDFTTAAWRKLCMNAAGVVPALLGRGDGVTREPAIAELMRGIVRETIAVGRAEGARLDDALVEETALGFQRAPADRVNSLNADRQAGRRTEVDARNGAVVRVGARHGIATPLNSMALALMSVEHGSSPTLLT
jgi:2-dehydropantoate 2-reductase